MLIREIAGFDRPFGIRADASGCYYVADFKMNTVTKLALDGRQIWRLTGRDLKGPHSLCLDGRGNLYLTEFYGRRILAFDENGRDLRVLVQNRDEARPWVLAGPAGIHLDPEGVLIVGDYGSDSLQKFSIGGDFLGWRGAGDGGDWSVGGMPRKSDALGGFDRVHGAATLPDGTMLVVDTWNHRLQRFGPKGRTLAPIGGAPAGDAPGRFHAPVAVAVERNAIVVSEYGNPRLQRFAFDGSFIGLLGADAELVARPAWRTAGACVESGGPGGFRHPYDLDARDGVLYVADTDNHRVQIIEP